MTLSISRPLVTSERLGRLEDPAAGDFPFYDGLPMALSGLQWLALMAGVVAGFLVLILPIPWPGGVWAPLIPALLFPAIPLATLYLVALDHWTVLFGRVGVREVRLMFGFALLNIIVTLCVGALVRTFADVTSNAAAAQLANADMAGRIAFFVKTLPQLLGEELVTVLPFLSLTAALTKGFGMARRSAVIGAWLLSSLLFGLIHLPTYDWNWIQCIVIIGTARLVLTLPWLLTKNLWVSTGAHIVNDWLLFGVALLGAGLAGRA